MLAFLLLFVTAALILAGIFYSRYLWRLKKLKASMDAAMKSGCPVGELPRKESEERTSPYYLRTRHHLYNVYEYSAEQLSSGAWYGREEWLQDVIAGKAETDDFTY